MGDLRRYHFKKIADRIEKGEVTSAEISEGLVRDFLYDKDMPDPDLLIRTSGEYRVSNFLLRQLAYTEIYITPVLWPDFTRDEFFAAVRNFQKRQRRFGNIQNPSANKKNGEST